MIGLDSPSISSTPILTPHPSQTHTLTQSTTLVTTVLVSQLFYVTPGDILIVYKATVKKTIFVLISKFQWLSIQYVRLVRDLCEYSPQILDKCTVRSLIAVQLKTSIDLFFQNTCFSSLCECSPQILDKCTVRSLIAVQLKTSIDLFFQSTCFSSDVAMTSLLNPSQGGGREFSNYR